MSQAHASSGWSLEYRTPHHAIVRDLGACHVAGEAIDVRRRFPGVCFAWFTVQTHGCWQSLPEALLSVVLADPRNSTPSRRFVAAAAHSVALYYLRQVVPLREVQPILSPVCKEVDCLVVGGFGGAQPWSCT
jgi:hypothetical protein